VPHIETVALELNQDEASALLLLLYINVLAVDGAPEAYKPALRAVHNKLAVLLNEPDRVLDANNSSEAIRQARAAIGRPT